MYRIAKLPTSVKSGTVLSCCKVATRRSRITRSWEACTTFQKPTNDHAMLAYHPHGHRLKSTLRHPTPEQLIAEARPGLVPKNNTAFRSSSLYAPTDYDHGSCDKNPIPDFNNARAAFEEKTTWELLRAAICFRLCMIKKLVDNAEDILRYSRLILGDFIVNQSLKLTMYGHFCAGEDEARIKPVLKRLEKLGVGSILDYVAEADPNEQKGLAREYSYESEAKCDEHVETFLQCIGTVANMGPDGYAAIKVTALGNPKLLARLSTAIEETKRLFETFDENGDGVISRKEFENGYNRFFVDGETRIKEILEEFDPDNTGYIDYITWANMLSPRDLPEIVKSCNSVGRLSLASPTEQEIELLDAMFNRGRMLGEEAGKTGTRLLIDAEQYVYQHAIDNLVLELQQKFNSVEVADKPIIYNTYQCYRKDTPERLRIDVDRSERYNYHFGAKLVRGAYMKTERENAEKFGIPDPIHANINDTHACYDESVDYLLHHSTKSYKKVELMCATHNQASIEKAIESMNRHGIDRRDSTICFGQLYGMSDPLTFNLGSHGFRAFKYVPYGEVKEATEYLLRRALENSSMIEKTRHELVMIKRELQRRAFQTS